MADNRLNSCKICFRVNKNKDSSVKATRKYRAKEENKLKIIEYRKKYHQENRDTILEKMKEWHRINKHLSTFHKAKRRAIKKRATPWWSESESIKHVYKEARRLTELTGIQFHVDHVIPLTNSKVQGLHVLANLRIVPYYENLQKHNKLIEDIV